ncbi:MAG: CDP-tyvelose-2-epimerase (CDP-paratose 2-epimerase)-like protein [Actinomycetia bacterium]|nr:CDP-tyvelose-2-epimerase (CDP-paratose 2-epimerase)-like protein [Actinomycetes bacterium]
MRAPSGHILITGGAGFVGTNLADRLLGDGRRVVVFDNLSRPGVEENLHWLQARHGGRVMAMVADVRDADALRVALAGVEAVFHLAGQVAVTTSVELPLEDFDVNLRATLMLLEELRRLPRPVPLLFTSTNKVYGSLPDVPLHRCADRWEPVDHELRDRGIGERRRLDFCTPYGCSKGGADQYVLDYANTFGLPAVVFRMSCIYGEHQHGTEDQGWLAHFLIRTRTGAPVTVYGDGAQVRDVLFVTDLVDAMLRVSIDADRLAGRAFNLGGGPANTLSLLELLQLIEEIRGEPSAVTFAEERAGDQRWYVADTSQLRAETGWRPLVDAEDGVEALERWVAGRETSALSAAKAS